MQVAANRLAGSTAKLAAIAAEVGYESEAAFSRAFKRATGQSPAHGARRGAWARRGCRTTREQEIRTLDHRRGGAGAAV
jgi:AraC-like DNA-binding protein